jgi:hypothetical protein
MPEEPGPRSGAAARVLLAWLVVGCASCDRGSLDDYPVFIPPPPESEFTPEPPPAPLTTPMQLSPPDGSVFDHPHPRTVTLAWTEVPEATLYHVDLDVCQNPSCAATDPGLIFPWKPPVHNLEGTSVTLVFVGAQPGRWRVWATGEGDRTSPKSGWWEFRFTR